MYLNEYSFDAMPMILQKNNRKSSNEAGDGLKKNEEDSIQ
jgi:hypothetical protein